jgi:hypothetical protein
MCAVLKPAIDAQLGSGRALICGQDTVGVIGPIKPPKPFETLCPHGDCGLIGQLVNEGCPILNPQRSNVPGVEPLMCRPALPACDPRCSRVDCCGGPSPNDFKRGDMLLAWADGGEVLVADGVRIQRSGQTVPEPLKAGTRVAAGDLVAIPPGSRFELRTRQGRVLRTPEKGMPHGADEPVALMMITGESALQTRQAGVPPPQKLLPLERIARVRGAPWAARGEGGMLLDEARIAPFKYPEEEVGRDDLRRRGLLPEQLGKR